MNVRKPLLVTVLVAFLCPVLGMAQDFSWNGALSPGQTLTVRGINGSIEATLADGVSAEVVARKRSFRSDPDSVEIRVVEHPEGVTICALYPSRFGRDENDCLPFGKGNSSNHNNDVQVEFLVRVPPQVHFIGRNVNGNVEAEGLDGDVEVSTVNGSVDISTTGIAEASTVNGSIRAEMGAADWDGELEFSSVNGSIRLSLPDHLNTRFKAECLNGSIDSEFDMRLEGRSRGFRPGRKKSVSGVIGGDSAGRNLRLETVNGDVEIRRLRGR